MLDIAGLIEIAGLTEEAPGLLEVARLIEIAGLMEIPGLLKEGPGLLEALDVLGALEGPGLFVAVGVAVVPDGAAVAPFGVATAGASPKALVTAVFATMAFPIAALGIAAPVEPVAELPGSPINSFAPTTASAVLIASTLPDEPGAPGAACGGLRNTSSKVTAKD
jgi:hypothetical protein